MANLDELEKQVLASLLTSVENCQLFKQRNFTDEFFLFPEPKKLFVILWYHYEKNLAILHGDDLDSLLRQSSKMSDDYKNKLRVFYEEVKLIPPISTFNVLLDEFLLHYKNHQLQQALTLATSSIADKDPDKAMAILQTGVQQLREKTTKDDIDSGFFGDPNRDLISLYDKKKEHPELFRGIELGFPTLDSAVTHKPSTVTLIVGQMKSAKSVLMVNLAVNMISKGKRVYYHVNEGGRELVENRIISCETGLSMTKIDRNTLTDAEYDTYKKCYERHRNSNSLFIDSVATSNSSAAYIEDKVTRLQALHGKFDCIIIDYLALMQSSRKADAEYQRYGFISMELKDIAKKLNIPIILIAHVNRDGMKDKKKHYELEEVGLSLEPLKNVDVIISWRIHDTDFFELSNTGQGTLSIRGSRQSGQKSVVLEVDTTKMKIWENVRQVNIGVPPVSTPDNIIPSLLDHSATF